jgi:predicted enzyme related to lactoylglutathione lyase
MTQYSARKMANYREDPKRRMKERGAEFTMPPTDVTASKIAILKDTCGNLIQLTQLASYSR